MPEIQALPENAVLVHIGPPKTGTTYLQHVLADRRQELRQRGILYPGTGTRHVLASWALRGAAMPGYATPPPEAWHRLAQRVRGHQGRAVVSSEAFATLPSEKAAQLVHDFGEDRVHVVMTIRSLDRLVPSAWQQQVKNQVTSQRYGEFLERLFPEDDAAERAPFWQNQGADDLIDRWLEVLAADRIIVVVADDSDHDRLARTFERLLDLPESMLTPSRPAPDNRSLTWERVELLRRINVAADRNEWEQRVHRYVNQTIVRGISRVIEVDPQQIPELPSWAAERAARVSEHRAAVVEQSSVRVVGDPLQLHYQLGTPAPELPDEPQAIGIDTAVAAIEVVVAEAIDGRLAELAIANADEEDLVARVGGRALLRGLTQRCVSRLRGDVTQTT